MHDNSESLQKVSEYILEINHEIILNQLSELVGQVPTSQIGDTHPLKPRLDELMTLAANSTCAISQMKLRKLKDEAF